MTIPQRLRDIARSVHELEYGQPGALADSLRTIAAELEAPAADAVPVVAYSVRGPIDDHCGLFENHDIALQIASKIKSECGGSDVVNLVRQRDHIAAIASERKHASKLRETFLRMQQEHAGSIAALQVRINELESKLNTPQLHDFASAVVLEAAHQRERWGADHDAGKQPADWFWLLGYLGGKALNAAVSGNHDKALHHTISTAAACANWHAALTGEHTAMRPGIDPVARGIDPQTDTSKEQP